MSSPERENPSNIPIREETPAPNETSGDLDVPIENVPEQPQGVSDMKIEEIGSEHNDGVIMNDPQNQSEDIIDSVGGEGSAVVKAHPVAPVQKRMTLMDKQEPDHSETPAGGEEEKKDVESMEFSQPVAAPEPDSPTAAEIVPFYPDVDHNVSGVGLTKTQYGQFGEAKEIQTIKKKRSQRTEEKRVEEAEVRNSKKSLENPQSLIEKNTASPKESEHSQKASLSSKDSKEALIRKSLDSKEAKKRKKNSIAKITPANIGLATDGDVLPQKQVKASTPIDMSSQEHVGMSLGSADASKSNVVHVLSQEEKLEEKPDEDNILLDEQVKKYMESRSSLASQSWANIISTVLNYLSSDIKKKQRTFKIGVFTIFLVVSFVTFLKAAVDVAPVAFLKVGQDQAGSLDFMLASDYSSRMESGDWNIYSEDPFEYNEEVEQQSFLQQIQGTSQEQGDHYELFGFNLLNFGNIQHQLDELSEGELFKGFSPRWMMPTKLRNVTAHTTNTSCILLIIDSEREVNLEFANGFSDEIIGDSEVMISDAALRHLNVSSHRKEKVEVYFDLMGLMQTFASVSGDSFGFGGGGSSSEGESAVEEGLNNEMTSALASLLPSSKEIISILRRDFGLPIKDDNTVEINVNQLIEENFDLSQFNITIPTLNISTIFPQLDLDQYDGVNLTSSDPSSPLNNLNLKDLIDGDLTFTVDQLLSLFDSANVTTIDIPVDVALDSILGLASLPSSFAHNFTVIDSFSKSSGKYGETLGNVAIIDCHYANRLIANTYADMFQDLLDQQPFLYVFMSELDKSIKSSIKDINFCTYALNVYGVLNDQVGTYVTTRQDMESQVGSAGNQILQALSLKSNVTITTPLKAQMASVELLQTFMNTNMTTVVAFLIILCVQLIYSLMLSDVDEKTYEFGMLRALGFNTKNLMLTITFQAVTFSLPGLATGLVFAAALNFILRYIIYDLTGNYDSYFLSSGSIYLSVGIGILIPLFSNILPIQKALGKNLRQSLDIYHRSAGELSVSIKKLQDIGLSVPQLVLSIMLVVGGIFTYYVAPTAFLYQKYSLFFFILNSLLLCMILGLTFVAILVLPFLMNGLLSLFLLFVPKDRKLKFLIQKNMQAHQTRNTKTAIMFAICLSFLIFAGSSFKLLGDLIVSQLEIAIGSDIYAVTLNPHLSTMIDEIPISEFLEEQKQLDGAVENYSFTSFSLMNLIQEIQPQLEGETYFSDMSGYKEVLTNIYSVQENFLETANPAYYMLNEVNQDILDQAKDQDVSFSKVPGGNIDAVQLIYSNLSADIYSEQDDGKKKLHDLHGIVLENKPVVKERENYDELKVLLPEGFRDVLSLDTTRKGRFCIDPNGWGCVNPYKVSLRAMITKLPAWFFTSYQNVQFFSQQLVTEQQYMGLLKEYLRSQPQEVEDNFNSMINGYSFQNDIPKYKMLVKLNSNVTDERRDFIANGIRSFFRDDTTVLLDLKDSKNSAQTALIIFDVFVAIVGGIALILAFFLLLISTTQNIRENVWEYGCQRAMGFSKAQGVRSFMYEQYAVVIASLLIGTVVGFVLAAIVTAQFFLFLEFPFKLSFPYTLLYVMYAMAILTTFYAVYVPVRKINKMRVASTIKGFAS